MKKLLVSLVALALCVSMTGFTFYEETETLTSSSSARKTGIQYDYYKDYSIALPLTLGGMDVDSDTMGIYAMSEDMNLAVVCMRIETGYLYGDFFLDEFDALLNELNDYGDYFSIASRQLISHPLADNAYQHSIIVKDGNDTATCKLTYFETSEAFYIFVTGYLEYPGEAVVEALDSIPLTLTEY